MRFGCNANMVASGPDGTGVEIVEKLASYGYDYIELPLAEMTALSKEDFEALKDRVDKSGIHCETCNNLFPGSLRLTGPDADMEKVREYLKDALGRAAELGVSVITFGSGPAKMVPEGFSMEEGYRQVIDVCRILAEMSKPFNIRTAIEPLRKPECNIINSFADGVQLAKDVDDPAIKVLIDYYHMDFENESPDALLEYGRDYLIHVHIANPDGRVYPISDIESGYRQFADVLKTIGYNDRVSIEAYSSDFDYEAPKALKLLKSVFN